MPAAIAVVAVAGYLALFLLGRGSLIFGERTFASQATGDAAPLNVYVEVLGIDPVRQALRLQIDVADGSGPHGTHYFGRSTRTADLRISDGNVEQDVAIRRNAPMPSTTFVAGLQGAVGDYPFDRYAVRTLVTASERSHDTRRRVPIRLTVWDDQPGWHLALTTDAQDAAASLALNFAFRRATPLVLFAAAMYGVMVLVAAAAVSIAALAARDARRLEATLIGALAAMVFALPALRNTLPGAPPLGVAADVFVFLWAELSVVVALAILVIAWAVRPPKRAS